MVLLFLLSDRAAPEHWVTKSPPPLCVAWLPTKLLVTRESPALQPWMYTPPPLLAVLFTKSVSKTSMEVALLAAIPPPAQWLEYWSQVEVTSMEVASSRQPT